MTNAHEGKYPHITLSIIPYINQFFPSLLSLSHILCIPYASFWSINNIHETRRIRLLDDGLPGSPMDRYDFGASPGKL